MTYKQLIAAACVSVAVGLPADAHAHTKLIAYYPFCGNARDASGNGNHGVVMGATLAPDMNGRPSSAYFFDRSKGNAIRIPHQAMQNLPVNTGLTLTMWINIRNYPAPRPNNDIALLGKQPSEGCGLLNHGGLFDFYLHQGRLNLLSEFVACDTEGWTANMDPLPTNVWKHLAATINVTRHGVPRSEELITFYVDGEEVGRGVDGRVPGAVSLSRLSLQPIRIGERADSPSGITRFDGSMDEIRIYAGVLSAARIKEIRDKGSKTCSATVIK